jgi:hypothetical protein
MSETSISLPTIPVTSKTEWKVRAATLATYLAALAGSIFLSTTATDYVHALPDWAENIVYPALLAGVTYLTGRAAKTKPNYISASTAEAVEKAIAARLPRSTRSSR